MTQRTSYAQGTPSWVDLQTTDTEAAKAFYSLVFGWTFQDSPMPDGSLYSMAYVGRETVAGIAGQNPTQMELGVPPMWSTYLAVTDVDSATTAAAAAGGSVLMPPTDVTEAGRMSFVADPTGAAVGLWQAKGHIGAGLVNEPNALVWNELVTDNQAKALPFYQAIAGITSVESDMGGSPYTMLKVDGEDVGGATARQMTGVPNHWNAWFAVADTESAVAATAAAGGSIFWGPEQMPIGTAATVRDPQGAVFSILQLADQG